MMSEERRFTMSMYANKEALYMAKAQYYQGKVDALQCHVERLRESLRIETQWESREDGMVVMVNSHQVWELLESTPAQSLAHIENRVIEECADIMLNWHGGMGLGQLADGIRNLKREV